jgi:hypothetical protein
VKCESRYVNEPWILQAIRGKVQTVKSSIFTVVVLMVAASVGQKAPKPRSSGFHWDWEHPKRLDKVLADYKDLSLGDRSALLRTLTPKFSDYPSPPSPTERAEQTRMEFIDLNNDGVPEVIAQLSGDACSPTGNCPLYILQKVGADYRVILEKGAAHTVTVQKTRSHGYLDVAVGMHGSATEQGLFVYQFREGRYWRTGCYDAFFTYIGKDGEEHELKEPLITACGKE